MIIILMLESVQNAVSQLLPTEWILLVLFGLFYLFEVAYLIFFLGKVAFLKEPPIGEQAPLSLILTFRNEEDNIKRNIPRLLSLGNSIYEIIAVDDFSHDNSLTVLGAFKQQNEKLRISSLNEETRFSEKMAQNIALKAALHNWAMVIPASVSQFDVRWISEISFRLSSQKELLINYSNQQPNGTFINKLYRVEFFFQQLKSFGFSLNGLPFVVSEENVAFKKINYFESGGYRGKISEPFANLELVINSFIRKSATQLLLSDRTVIFKNECVTGRRFSDLLKKEIRIRSYLSAIKRFLIAAVEWSWLLFITTLILICIFLPVFLPLIAALLFVLILGSSLIIKKILNRLAEGKLFLPSLLLGLFLPFFKLFYRAVLHKHGNKNRWKGKK